jgi:triacylglycerol lipase
MYFPKQFNVPRAIELGQLVDQAYAQFESFKNGTPWKLTNGYLMKQELHLERLAGKTTSKIAKYFDFDVAAVNRSARKGTKPIPIGYIAQRNDAIYLIFRGTMTAREWIKDFNIGLVPHMLPGQGKVHDGFQQLYGLMHSTIIETLGTIKLKRKLFIAGHSLGAALATLAFADIGAAMDWKTEEMYTFGSPRVGDNDFVTAFNRRYAARSYRIINTSDIVGSIPLPVPIVGIVGGYFSHVETPIDFTFQADDLEQNHMMKTYLSALEDANRRKGILGRLKSWGA